MVMDDDLMIRKIIKTMLKQQGHKVLLAEDGHEAIRIYSEYFENNQPIDVIIMDLTVPGGMGGKEALQEILQINPEAEAVVSSGYSNDSVVSCCQEYGFISSIVKPFQASELNKLINEIIQQD